MLAVQVVEGTGHSANTLPGVYQHRLRRIKPLTGLQKPLEAIRMDAHGQAQRVHLIQLCLRFEVAGIHQIDTVDISLLLVCAGTCNHHKRMILMACPAGQRINRKLSLCDGSFHHIALSGPCTVERGQFIILIGYIQTGAHDALKVDPFFSLIDHCGTAQQSIRILKNAVAQNDLQAQIGVSHGYFQSLGIVTKGGRHAGQRRLTAEDPVFLVPKAAHPVSCIAAHRHSSATKIARTENRILKGHCPVKTHHIPFHRMQRTRGFLPWEQVVTVRISQLCAVVKMLQMNTCVNAHHVGGILCVDLKDLRLLVIDDAHNSLLKDTGLIPDYRMICWHSVPKCRFCSYFISPQLKSTVPVRKSSGLSSVSVQQLINSLSVITTLWTRSAKIAGSFRFRKRLLVTVTFPWTQLPLS